MEQAKVIRTQEDGDKFFFGDQYFAFLDVLGFGDFVTKNAHSTVVGIYDALINTPIQTYNKLKQAEAELRTQELGTNANLSGLRVINVSDSIILWTENSKQGSILDLLYAVKLFMSVSMKMGIPLRGAVSMGDIAVFENNGNISIVGRPVVHAVQMEKHQKWSGCIVFEGIITYLRSFEKVVRERDIPSTIERVPNLLIPYNIPVDGGVKPGYAINWVAGSQFTEDGVRASFAAHNKRINGVADKIDNTVAFLHHCLAQKI